MALEYFTREPRWENGLWVDFYDSRSPVNKDFAGVWDVLHKFESKANDLVSVNGGFKYWHGLSEYLTNAQRAQSYDYVHIVKGVKENDPPEIFPGYFMRWWLDRLVDTAGYNLWTHVFNGLSYVAPNRTNIYGSFADPNDLKKTNRDAEKQADGLRKDFLSHFG